MRYRVRINDYLNYIVGNRPRITGLVTADGAAPDLMAATVILQSYENTTLPETLGTVDAAGNVSFNIPELTRTEQGRVLVNAYENAGSATLTAELSVSATTIGVTGESTTLPENGFCKVNNEIMKYTLSGSTLTLIRGFVGNAAVHASGDTVIFSNSVETCEPYERYTVIRKSEVFSVR